MNFEIISTEQRLQEVISQWESLISDSYISMSPDWLVNWWHCYKDEKLQLHLYTAWDCGELKALLPLMLETSDEGTRLRFLSNSCSDYLTVAVKDNNLHYIDFLVEQMDTDNLWDILFLNNLDTLDFRADYLLKKLIAANYETVAQKHDEVAKIEINCPWKDFIKERSHNTRHMYTRIEKHERKFKFQVYTQYDQSVVNSLFGLHESRWENANYSSVFSDNNRRKFFHLIASSFSSKNEMILFTLYIEDRIVAYRFGFIKNGTYFDWNTSFDPLYAEYSCGRILLKKIYEYCFDNEIKTFDFLKGLEPYKKQLMTCKSFLYSITSKRQKREIHYLPPKQKIKEIIARTSGVIFDLDGVVYSGKQPITDTIRVIEYLRARGIKIGFLTNTSAKTICEIEDKLYSMGVTTQGCSFMTSAVATGRYLKENNYESCVVFSGGSSLFKEINRNKIAVFDNKNIFGGVPKAVVIGYTTNFTYEDILFCSDLINRGAQLICTDKDNRFAHNGGWLPGTGWVVSSLEWVTSQRAIVIGKPNTISLKYIIEEMNLDTGNLLMVGDNIDTDILAAKSINMASCLLLGGISERCDVAKKPNDLKPDIVVDSLLNISNYFSEV